MERFIKCVDDYYYFVISVTCSGYMLLSMTAYRYWPDMSLSLVSPLIMMVTVQPPPVLASVIASRNYTQIEQL